MSNEKENKKEEIDFTKFLVFPHTKKSRDVTDKDLDEVIRGGHIMYNICYSIIGIHPGAFAVAHSQINDKDPLRFFVTNMQEIIINPVIINHTQVTIDSEEGCISFPEWGQKTVKRYNKITTTYQTIEKDGKLSDIMERKIGGREAKIWQHEIDHMDGKYIFDIDLYKDFKKLNK